MNNNYVVILRYLLTRRPKTPLRGEDIDYCRGLAQRVTTGQIKLCQATYAVAQQF
jgi:hypothetical protein